MLALTTLGSLELQKTSACCYPPLSSDRKRNIDAEAEHSSHRRETTTPLCWKSLSDPWSLEPCGIWLHLPSGSDRTVVRPQEGKGDLPVVSSRIVPFDARPTSDE